MVQKRTAAQVKNNLKSSKKQNNKQNEKKYDATLFILTKNEIKGLTALFQKIPITRFAEVIAIDAQSTDGSKEFLLKKGLRVITQKKMGRAEAFRIGCAVAAYENVIFFSPDGNEDPADIVKLAYWLEQGYDMSVGSRFMKGGRSDDDDVWLPIRGLGNKGFTLAADILWGGHLTDSINGFRGVKKSKLWKLNPDSEGFGIEFQISIRALKLRYKIKEIPTYEGDRIGGQSTARTFATGWYFIKLLLGELFIGKSFLRWTQIKNKYKLS
ncbi:glycosyltransferase family 2 protein [Candidatus Woesearchaeota archaeon]|nr:glycosyltransferase family 2 protein [Candidatus Woesearchaeota archaeon]